MDAYLDTKPEEMSHTRRAEYGGLLPPKGALSYLLDMFNDIGGVVSDGIGSLRPINWQDLNAYLSVTKQELEHWEAKAIIDMSLAYLNEHIKAQKPTAQIPYYKRPEK